MKIRKRMTIFFLILSACFIHAQNPENQWLLAAYQNDFHQMKILLDSHYEVLNARDVNGATVVHYAVVNQNADMLEWLCDMGADVNISDNQGLTPLMLAVSTENEQISQLLLQCGANPNAQDQHLLTPLHYAMYQTNPHIIQILLVHGSEPLAKDIDGNTPLHHLSTQQNNFFHLLASYYKTTHIPNFSGQTPLLLAIEYHNTEFLRHTLEHETLPDSTAYIKKIIYSTFMQCHSDVIQLLSEHISHIPALSKDTAHAIWKHFLRTKNCTAEKSMFRKFNIQRPHYPVFSNVTLNYGIQTNGRDLLWMHGVSINEANYNVVFSTGISSRYWKIRQYYQWNTDTIYLLREYRALAYGLMSKKIYLFHSTKKIQSVSFIPGIGMGLLYETYAGLKRKHSTYTLLSNLVISIHLSSGTINFGYFYLDKDKHQALRSPSYLNCFITINIFQFK